MLAKDQDSFLEIVTTVIAHSQIVVREPTRPVRWVPAAFDAVDIAILEWIASEARCGGRSFARVSV